MPRGIDFVEVRLFAMSMMMQMSCGSSPGAVGG
jgi:hypothetical protein